MKCLLDTHTFLWVLFDDEKLAKKARAAIEDPENEIFVSIVSYWEISLKYAIDKLELEGVAPETLLRIAKDNLIATLEVSPEEATTFYRLPRLKHKDPFDRLIIWQAIHRDLIMISKDRSAKEYQKFGLKLLWS